jgi:outer membrane protein OmpA-like peptidoglycan-associated protein
MNPQRISPLRAAVAATLLTGMLGACATYDVRPTALEDARLAVETARANPTVVTLAPVELSDAVVAYRRADERYHAEGDTAEVRHLGYVAMRRAEIAQETASLKASEQEITRARTEREQVRLLAREREAQDATRTAAAAQAQADAARQQAASAQQQAVAAQDRARQLQLEAQMSQQQVQAAQEQSARLAAELRELQAQPTDRGMVVTLSDVLFDTGRAELRPGAMRVLQRLADFMREYPDRIVAVEGFTDSVGPDAYNEDLSRRRAEAVRSALVDDGIAGSRIVTRGLGEAYPVASNDTAEGRQRNRRVEVVISDDHGVIGPRVATYVPAVR